MATTVGVDAIPDLRPPWQCFGVDIPGGIIGPDDLFCLVRESADDGFKVVVLSPDMAFIDMEPNLSAFANRDAATLLDFSQIKNGPDEIVHETLDKTARARLVALVGRLIVGVCIEVAYTPSIGGGGGEIKRKRGEPCPWSFELRRDIRIDARPYVREYIAGNGRSPSVQALVRGHYKNQACGKGHLIRKWIHVEPYWRGPEDAPIAVRAQIFGTTEVVH